MKFIKLTKNKEAIVDDEDYEYLNRWKWYYNSRYVIRTDNLNGKKISLHRLIMNCPDNLYVDHINGDPLDNRKENLRLCSTKDNGRNRKTNKTNKRHSKFKGVSKTNNKYWRSYIKFEGKQIFIGLFNTELEAAIAYNEKAKELFGKFAKLNEIC